MTEGSAKSVAALLNLSAKIVIFFAKNGVFCCKVWINVLFANVQGKKTKHWCKQTKQYSTKLIET